MKEANRFEHVLKDLLIIKGCLGSNNEKIILSNLPSNVFRDFGLLV